LVKRDPYLDYLRGIAIAWVVLVHVFYLKQLVPPGSLGQAVKAAILFEMPLFFFVSGASLYHSHLRQPAVGRFLARRAWRLLAPYVLLAVVCSYLFYRRELAAGHLLTAEQAVSWLRLGPWPVEPVYVGAYMWFIRVMLAVTVAHVALVRLFGSDRWRAPTAAVLALGVLAFTPIGQRLPEFHAVPVSQLPQYAGFYGAFAYLGYYYASGRLTAHPGRLALAAAGAFGLLAALASAGLVSGDMQLDKFPPNVGYGLFGLGWVTLWVLARPAVLGVAEGLRPVGATLRFLGGRSYSLYLWHGFGLWATDYALPYLHISDHLQGVHYAAWLMVYFAFTLGFSAGIAGAAWLAGAAIESFRRVPLSRRAA
jgi:peptidoglycan/LPS O-acetylase OafA/YrhL